MKDPGLVPDPVNRRLKEIGLWDLDPANLFRITWKNEPVKQGGGFCEGPTGAHKVGAAYGCLIPRLVTGAFDPDTQKAVWPSTGNYCRGGAYDCALLACPAVAILPEGMMNVVTAS
jgi:hypothetical protein